MQTTAVGQNAALSVLWGKSKGPSLLVQHLLDTAAVAELLWDNYLAPTLRQRIDASCAGKGKQLYAFLCALHDVGKASPAFQCKVPDLAERVKAIGLTWGLLDDSDKRWHHSKAGAAIVLRALTDVGWSKDAVSWVWPLVAGHHGRVCTLPEVVKGARGRGHGRGPLWTSAQDDLVHQVARLLDVDVRGIEPARLPRRAEQLALSGAIIMADWIASNDDQFPAVDDLDAVTFDEARRRAVGALGRLGIYGGWRQFDDTAPHDLVAARFGCHPRPLQEAVVEAATSMPAPGLLIIEAPMGEGKTEAALAAVEVIARSFGADGVFVGMPTQATSDSMFRRVKAWAQSVHPDVAVALLHGKRQFNPQWKDLLEQAPTLTGVDELGCDDEYATVSAGLPLPPSEVPAQWLLGPKRGLLTPVCVGTIDQLLHAATRTKHVMLRHFGLAGRVVVLDEVHAYDVYMSQFLFEALRWLADAGVPVIVLSATLPPRLRDDLARAYAQGAAGQRDVDVSALPQTDAYPATTSVSVVDGEPRFGTASAKPWRDSLAVTVDVLDETDDPHGAVVSLLDESLAEGGCALVIRNTVDRAQQTFQALRARFGDDVELLHARLTVASRADRTQGVLDRLGAGIARPDRLIVVATQVAEQSFDVDADLLVTDIAPIDLLLQRAGRLHRHERPVTARPERVRRPRMVVTGLARSAPGAPRLDGGSKAVYSAHPLLRAAALVLEAVERRTWSVPADVPELVRRGYSDDDITPASWRDRVSEAHKEWLDNESRRRAKAKPFLLAGEDQLGEPTLAGLHYQRTADLADEDQVAAVVRDGDESIEVVLVRSDERRYHSYGGEALGPNGEVDNPDLVAHVMGAAVRLPARKPLTDAAKIQLRPLPGWTSHPQLRHCRALVLDDTNTTNLADHTLTYDDTLGLLVARP